MEFQIKDKVFVVTGAAKGIGAATVRAFLEAGAKHVAILDVDNEGMNVENELNKKYGDRKTKFFKCDVTNAKELKEVFNEVKDKNNYIDAVFNNAGIMNDNVEAYKEMIDTNVTAVVTGTLIAIELMRKDKGGRGGTVINTSSVAALYQNELLPIYYATKSAILQFTNCIGKGKNFERTGVRCVTICFGVTDTALFDKSKKLGYDDDAKDDIFEAILKVPKQRPQSAAACVLEAYRKGDAGSTWLSYNDKQAIDLTEDIKDGHAIFTRHYLN